MEGKGVERESRSTMPYTGSKVMKVLNSWGDMWR